MLLVQPMHAHTHAPNVNFHEPFRKPLRMAQAVNDRRSMPAPLKTSRSRPPERPRSTALPAGSFPPEPAMADDQLSAGEESPGTIGTSNAPPMARTRPRRATESASSSRRAGRSKTSFRLALPPPRHRQRIRLRPKLILQVQQISHTTRPVPKLDVLPSAFFGTFFGLKAHYMLNVRFSRCGPADVVIVPSDSYTTPPAAEDGTQVAGSDDDSEHRELVAAITMPKKEYQPNGEICLAQGSRWDAILLANGNYEFVSTVNGVKTVARWVVRKNRRSTITTLPAHEDDKRAFTFSLIDPTTRRHPVIGWLDSKGVDVADRFCPTPEFAKRQRDIAEVASDDELIEQSSPVSTEERPVVEMDDFTRTLIVATSIYVALREGWARNEISSTPDSGSLQPSPALMQRPPSTPPACQAAEPTVDPQLLLRRRRSSQFSSFFEKTTVAFRRSLSHSIRSSQSPSVRRAHEASNPSRLSSRQSLVSCESPNRPDVRANTFPRRNVTAPLSHHESGSNTLLTYDDAGMVNTCEDHHNDSTLVSHQDDCPPVSPVVSSPTEVDRACSPSPDLSSHDPPSALFVTGPQPSRHKTKWRKFGHWLKPLGGKKDKRA